MTEKLSRVVERYARRRDIHGLVVRLERPSAGLVFERAAGRFGADPEPAMAVDSPCFVASTTKLYVTAILLKLAADHRIDLDAPFARTLPQGLVDGLHVIDGIDRTDAITVRQLMAHTSGLADYFEQPDVDGEVFSKPILAGKDRAFTLDDVLRRTRERQRPRFIPGTPGKAHYSDTNYQLLGSIIEAVVGAPLAEVIDAAIARPLGLSQTYLFTPQHIPGYREVATLWSGARPIVIPQAMASVGADGGIVSTAPEMLVFLRAFFGGRLFPAAMLPELMVFNRIFYPLDYGVGLMQFRLPWYFSPFRRVPDFLGHSGASGTVLFHAPERDLWIAAMVNQVENRGLPFRLLIELAMAASR